MGERSEIEETGEYDLEGLFVRLDHAIRSTGAKRIVLDTIESLFSGLSNANILRAELWRLFRWLKDKGLTAVLTAERGEGTLTRQGLEEYRTTACVSQMQEDDDMQQSLPSETNPDTFVLRLYIAGQTPKCIRAFFQRVLAGLDVNVAAA
jgi:KaiC/GvpD/RAD55 family RecA-like ATPase